MQADKHRPEREYQVGDYVYVKLQPYKQTSVELKTRHKLAAKYFGPFSYHYRDRSSGLQVGVTLYI